jgi:predicted nucleotidyltransferase
MDLIKVLTIISKEFETNSIHYAIIGGFAMNALGLVRSTIDIDLLVLAQDTPKLHAFLTSLNYNRVYHSENVSQYVSPSNDLGEIDVLHAFRSVSLKMLSRSKNVSLCNNSIELKVIAPEDLIGLKLQALVNDETRREHELADIRMILKHFADHLDWTIIEDHFILFNQQPLFKQLKERYHG